MIHSDQLIEAQAFFADVSNIGEWNMPNLQPDWECLDAKYQVWNIE